MRIEAKNIRILTSLLLMLGFALSVSSCRSKSRAIKITDNKNTGGIDEDEDYSDDMIGEESFKDPYADIEDPEEVTSEMPVGPEATPDTLAEDTNTAQPTTTVANPLPIPETPANGTVSGGGTVIPATVTTVTPQTTMPTTGTSTATLGAGASSDTTTSTTTATTSTNTPPTGTMGAGVIPGIGSSTALKCFDREGVEISAQLQNQALNTHTNSLVDCYDKNGKKLYSGNAKNCFEELTARFGADIVFPAAKLFPTTYSAARSQGAKGQAALKETLESKKCLELKESA
jgi:hypothetical protein